jgi:hypothetical protein
MRTPGGYITVVDPGMRLHEQDTFTCIHCNKIVPVKPGNTVTDFAWCRKCMKPVCEREPCQTRCLPWDRQLEIQEARGKLRRALDETLKAR